MALPPQLKKILKPLVPGPLLRLYRKLYLRWYHTYTDPATHPAEAYYYLQYARVMERYLQPGCRVLDTGCHNGRFTQRLTDAGYRVTATDLYPSVVETAKQNVRRKELLEGAYAEDVMVTVLRPELQKAFHLVLAIEYLHVVREHAAVLAGLRGLVAPGGYLMATYRTPAFYIYRYLRERKYAELDQILQGTHPWYFPVDPDKLAALYQAQGLRILEVVPIGIASGYHVDTWAHIANPAKLRGEDLERLRRIELDSDLQRILQVNARFLLVVAEPLG